MKTASSALRTICGAAALVACTIGASTGALAADGKALYTQKLCMTCHGPDGKAPIAPMYPKLAGQNKAYLVQQAKDIKSGARANGQSAAMKGMVQALSDADMEAIAEYLSKVQ